MANDETKDDGITILAVPEDKAQAVIDFVDSLESEETEVSGHMLSRGLVGGINTGALSARKGRSLTGCNTTGGSGFGTDWECSDVDKA